jgi:hypothetical protein
MIFQRVSLPAFSRVLMLPLLQPLMGVLNHHDGGIDHRPTAMAIPPSDMMLALSPGNAS